MAAEEDGKSSRQKLLDRLQRTLNTLDDEEQLEEAVRAVEKLVSDREARQASLIRQLAFYFSDANLRRDRFLREKIVASEQGFVPLSVILPFNRLKLMGCVTEGELAAAVQAADPKFNMELSEEKDAIRRAGGAEPPSLSFGGAGSDLEKRSVQLSGFPKGDELVTIEEVSKLCEPFGKVDFVRLLREGPSDDGKIFMGSAEVEFQSEEAAKAVVGLERPVGTKAQRRKALCWKDKPLDAACRAR
ncbi:unnamed protein product [Effrenium voratum]|uniref:HTH La-type RNA-binding domain-containing protein n=1 Tax=Effrenium voratum TaxID=2562239 RepID=A0AA36IAR1_9DINO|nr:unnamed protein product [Effrenium voratum]